ncbi:MAG: oligoendopeptidase F [Anaerolineae bacterium]|nr:oligoendopeptidase F [Anaerolineae bacterium]
MTTSKVPPRSEIAAQFTWNGPSVFESVAAWEAEYNAILAALPGVVAHKNRISDGPDALAAALKDIEDVQQRAFIVYVYAGMSYYVDTTDQEAAGRLGKAQGLFGQVFAAVSYLDPALIEFGEELVRDWVKSHERLQVYAHYVDNLFRQQAHVRSAEVEEIMGMLAEPFGSVGTTANMLTDSDFKFPPAQTTGGGERDLTQGTIDAILHGPDRTARRTAWEGYADQYLAYKNTLANNLLTSVKQNVFTQRVRHHASTLDMALFAQNIPPQVFHNLLDIFQKNLPTWHKYWRVRRRALGVETLHPYDIWAPIARPPVVPYEQAVEWICAGLEPLGAEYVEVMRRGCVQDRWVDVYPNVGKTAGAFSSGTYGTSPFILMSYTDDISSVSTLAHELGHSMHSYLAWQTQPFVYSDYSLFAAEVASNFHQAMVRAYLLDQSDDPAFQIAVIEEAMDNFHRYFFIMPTLARFELEVHRRVEAGDAISPDGMNALMADLFEEAYGGEMHVDRERVGITWAQFGHLYVDYYVYQYATGISGANASARRILDGVPGAVEGHLNFLKAGGSLYAVDAIKLAGVDLSTPEPVETAFGVLTSLVDRLDELTR